MNLEQRFETAINQAEFNYCELKGFSVDPRLALKAGMAIGYRMGTDDFMRDLVKKITAPTPQTPDSERKV